MVRVQPLPGPGPQFPHLGGGPVKSVIHQVRDREVSSGSVGKGHVLLPAAGCLLVHYLRVLHGILASWAFSKIGNALEKILLTQL